MLEINDEWKEKLLNSLCTVESVCASCIESDELAIALLNSFTTSAVALLVGLGIYDIETSDEARTTILANMFEMRAAVRSGSVENVQVVAALIVNRIDLLLDERILSQDEFENE